MPDDIRASARYRELIARQEAMREPGFGEPLDVETAELSPDGLLVAVVVRIGQPDGPSRTELRVLGVDGSGGQVLLAGDGEGDVDAARWARDGRLAFLADHGHRHQPTPRLAEPGADGSWHVRELACPPGIPEHLRWSADGSRLLLTVAGLGAEEADGLGSGKLGQELATDAPSWWPDVEDSEAIDEWRSAWTLDVATGTLSRVSPDGVNVWEADWLGDDRVVAVATAQPAEDAWYRARLVRLGPGPDEVVTLHVPEWQIQFPEGSPDGSRVAVIEGVASDRYFTVGDVVVAEADGSGSRSLGWLGADIAAVRWTGPHTLVALGIDGLERVVLELDADGDHEPREAFRTSADISGSWYQVSAAAGLVALGLTGPDEPPRAVVLEAGRSTTLLTAAHPGHAIVRAALAHRKAIEWTAPDGMVIQGVLALPHGKPPYPTILWVHGGPVGAVGLSFVSPEYALLLEAGYAILDPNPRGSIGRGRNFAAAVVGAMGGPVGTGDLLAAVDHVVSLGIADPARLVVAGVSYGGYMAALLPTLDDRFAAAIVGSPITDLISAYHGSSLSLFVHDYVGGRPGDAIARYLERSPVFAGARLRTPSLISAGLRDRATPPGQAVELFRALRAQGTPAELLVYPEEGHSVRAAQARLDWMARIVLWLERFAPPRD
jgi:dipeptidyl aminopeptidase/acylaminoacyl peptidase